MLDERKSCASEPREFCVCVPALMNFYLYQPERKKGTQVPVSMFLKSPLKGSSFLEQCMRPVVLVLCQSVSLGHAQLYYCLKLQREKQQLASQPRQRTPVLESRGQPLWPESSPGLE